MRARLEGPTLKVSDFKRKKPLGCGQFGRVYQAKERVSGDSSTVALKVMDKGVLNERDMLDQIRRECRLHAMLVHDNICKMLAHFEDEDKVYLVLENCVGGTLRGAMEATKAKRFEEVAVARYVAELARALAHCHESGVLHLDVKPDNVLLDAAGRLKLCDFGWASDDVVENVRCGTLDYMSPEMVRQCDYAADADVWALGAVAYELLTGRPPFERDGEHDYAVARANTFDRILAHDYAWPAKPHVSRACRAVVDALLAYDPRDRMSIKQLLANPWIVKHTINDPRYKNTALP